MLEQGVGTLQLKAFENVAIVLDASESAANCQETVMQMGVRLLDSLPVGAAREVYFLSNPRVYDARELQRNTSKWRQQNQLRGSFLTPILERVHDCNVVVIGSGWVYDLDDWQDSEWSSKIFLMSVGESLRGQSAVGEEVDDVPHLLSYLHDPIVAVEITGESFMPYCWSNPEYRLVPESMIRLTGTNLQDHSVSVEYFGSEVKARVVRKSSEEFRSLKSAQRQIEEEWRPLTRDECSVFHQAVKGEEFTCPICHECHSVPGLRCDRRSGILGRPIYPSLGNNKGFVFFKETADGISYRFHPVNALRIGDSAVAVASGSVATAYEYNARQKKWLAKDRVKPYHALSDMYVAVA